MPKTITDQQLALLRARVNVILELAAQRDEQARADCAARLQSAIVDWEQEVKGRTTLNTLSDDQIRRLRQQMPWRAILFDAALAGHAKSRAECVSWIAEEEEVAEQRQRRAARGVNRPD